MKNINETLKVNLCNGCGICAGICPVKAISLIINENGFYRPGISSACVNCGKCLSICSGLDETVENSELVLTDEVFGDYKSIYSCWALDQNVRKNSSSGGFIRALLGHCVDCFDGIISLVDNKENALAPEVEVLKSKQEVLNVSKSKYFACEFSKGAEFLSENTGKYLVVGLPCHIASLKKAKRIFKADFVSVELFCGAVYSHVFMDKYLKFHLNNEIAEFINFKDKKTGWHNPSLTVESPSHTSSVDANNDLFYFAQRNKICTQERCLKCSLCYRGSGDITVGDFWGPKYAHDDEGVSLVIARSQAGEDLVSNCDIIYRQKEEMTSVYTSQPWFVDAHKRNLDSRQYDQNEIFPVNKILECEKRIDPFRKINRLLDEKSLFNVKRINEAMLNFVKKVDDINRIRNFYEYEVDYNEEIKEECKYKLFNFVKQRIIKQKKDRNSFLIIPSDCSFGSFGDQAMMLSLLDYIKKIYPNAKIGIFMMYPSPADYFLSYQGHKVSIYYRDNNDMRETDFKKLLNDYSNLIVVGADILDGGLGIDHALNYFSLIKIANENNLKTVINGFSYNSMNIPEIKNALKEISSKTILNLRDSVSYKRVSEFILENVNQTADIAFLFDENKYIKSNYCLALVEAINKDKLNGHFFIGLHLTFKTGAEEEKEEYISKNIQVFLQIQKENKNVSVLLLPHDKRVHSHIYPDDEFLQLLQDKFQSAGIKNVFFAKHATNAIDVKTLAGLMDLVITSRMHLAIASFSKNVPTISFIYQNKFEGLYDFYKFKKKFMHEKSHFSVSEITEEIEYIIKNHENIVKQIKNKNIEILNLAKNNLH